MKKFIILLLLISTPSYAQIVNTPGIGASSIPPAPDAANAVALQLGQLMIANAQLIERNNQLQKIVSDLEKKLKEK